MDDMEMDLVGAEPEEDAAPDASAGGPEITDEDRERGYRIGRWGGRPNYIELDGPLATLDEAQMIRHVAAQRRIRRN